MNEKHWNDLLKLLCMMILVDGKVYDEEIEAFKDAAIALRNVVNPDLMLTRHMAGDWFNQHKDDLAIGLSPVFYDSSVNMALNSLSGVKNKKGLLFALLKIAMSDGKRHPSEEKLLETACKTWGLDSDLLDHKPLTTPQPSSKVIYG